MAVVGSLMPAPPARASLWWRFLGELPERHSTSQESYPLPTTTTNELAVP